MEDPSQFQQNPQALAPINPEDLPQWADLGANPQETLTREAQGYGLTLSSAKRTPAHNRAVGGRPGSMHVAGEGWDFTGAPESMRAFTEHLRDTYGPNLAELYHDPVGGWRGGQSVGAIGKHSNHVHVAAMGSISPDALPDEGAAPPAAPPVAPPPAAPAPAWKPRPDELVAQNFESLKARGDLEGAANVADQLKQEWGYSVRYDTDPNTGIQWPSITAPKKPFKIPTSLQKLPPDVRKLLTSPEYQTALQAVQALSGVTQPISRTLRRMAAAGAPEMTPEAIAARREQWLAAEQQATQARQAQEAAAAAEQRRRAALPYIEQLAARGGDVLDWPLELIGGAMGRGGGAMLSGAGRLLEDARLGYSQMRPLAPLGRALGTAGRAWQEVGATGPGAPQPGPLTPEQVAGAAAELIPLFAAGGGNVGLGIMSFTQALGQGLPYREAVMHGITTAAGAKLAGALTSEVPWGGIRGLAARGALATGGFELPQAIVSGRLPDLSTPEGQRQALMNAILMYGTEALAGPHGPAYEARERGRAIAEQAPIQGPGFAAYGVPEPGVGPPSAAQLRLRNRLNEFLAGQGITPAEAAALPIERKQQLADAFRAEEARIRGPRAAEEAGRGFEVVPGTARLQVATPAWHRARAEERAHAEAENLEREQFGRPLHDVERQVFHSLPDDTPPLNLEELHHIMRGRGIMPPTGPPPPAPAPPEVAERGFEARPLPGEELPGAREPFVSPVPTPTTFIEVGGKWYPYQREDNVWRSPGRPDIPVALVGPERIKTPTPALQGQVVYYTGRTTRGTGEPLQVVRRRGSKVQVIGEDGTLRSYDISDVTDVRPDYRMSPVYGRNSRESAERFLANLPEGARGEIVTRTTRRGAVPNYITGYQVRWRSREELEAGRRAPAPEEVPAVPPPEEPVATPEQLEHLRQQYGAWEEPTPAAPQVIQGPETVPAPYAGPERRVSTAGYRLAGESPEDYRARMASLGFTPRSYEVPERPLPEGWEEPEEFRGRGEPTAEEAEAAARAPAVTLPPPAPPVIPGEELIEKGIPAFVGAPKPAEAPAKAMTPKEQQDAFAEQRHGELGENAPMIPGWRKDWGNVTAIGRLPNGETLVRDEQGRSHWTARGKNLDLPRVEWADIGIEGPAFFSPEKFKSIMDSINVGRRDAGQPEYPTDWEQLLANYPDVAKEHFPEAYKRAQQELRDDEGNILFMKHFRPVMPERDSQWAEVEEPEPDIEPPLLQIERFLRGEPPFPVVGTGRAKQALKKSKEWLGAYGARRPVVTRGMNLNTPSGQRRAIEAIVKHTLAEIRAWRRIARDYVPFYSTDITERTNPLLQKWAEGRYDRQLTDPEISFLHMLSAYASGAQPPGMDTAYGMRAFDEYVRTGTATGLGGLKPVYDYYTRTRQKADWIPTEWVPRREAGLKFDPVTGKEIRQPVYIDAATGKKTFIRKGNEELRHPTKRAKLTKAFNIRSLNRFNELLTTRFDGDLGAAIDWMATKHPWSEIVDMIGKDAAKKIKKHEYLDKVNPSFGVFALGDSSPKQGSYILNRWGEFGPITKDLWYARTMARYFGRPISDQPWGGKLNQENIKMRRLADEAWRQVARQLRIKPAEVQERMWDAERVAYAALGHSEARGLGYTSQGVPVGERLINQDDLERDLPGYLAGEPSEPPLLSLNSTSDRALDDRDVTSRRISVKFAQRRQAEESPRPGRIRRAFLNDAAGRVLGTIMDVQEADGASMKRDGYGKLAYELGKTIQFFDLPPSSPLYTLYRDLVDAYQKNEPAYEIVSPYTGTEPGMEGAKGLRAFITTIRHEGTHSAMTVLRNSFPRLEDRERVASFTNALFGFEKEDINDLTHDELAALKMDMILAAKGYDNDPIVRAMEVIGHVGGGSRNLAEPTAPPNFRLSLDEQARLVKHVIRTLNEHYGDAAESVLQRAALEVRQENRRFYEEKRARLQTESATERGYANLEPGGSTAATEGGPPRSVQPTGVEPYPGVSGSPPPIAGGVPTRRGQRGRGGVPQAEQLELPFESREFPQDHGATEPAYPYGKSPLEADLEEMERNEQEELNQFYEDNPQLAKRFGGKVLPGRAKFLKKRLEDKLASLSPEDLKELDNQYLLTFDRYADQRYKEGYRGGVDRLKEEYVRKYGELVPINTGRSHRSVGRNLVEETLDQLTPKTRKLSLVPKPGEEPELSRRFPDEQILEAHHGSDDDTLTPENLEEREPGYPGSLGKGIYFGQDEDTARYYGRHVVSTQVRVRNPLIIDPEEVLQTVNGKLSPRLNIIDETPEGMFVDPIANTQTLPFDVYSHNGNKYEVRDSNDLQGLRDWAESEGHDAIIMRNMRPGPREEMLIFNRNQIVHPTEDEPLLSKKVKAFKTTAPFRRIGQVPADVEERRTQFWRDYHTTTPDRRKMLDDAIEEISKVILPTRKPGHDLEDTIDTVKSILASHENPIGSLAKGLEGAQAGRMTPEATAAVDYLKDAYDSVRGEHPFLLKEFPQEAQRQLKLALIAHPDEKEGTLLAKRFPKKKEERLKLGPFMREVPMGAEALGTPLEKFTEGNYEGLKEPDGSPKVLQHVTNEDFHTFDTKGRRADTDEIGTHFGTQNQVNDLAETMMLKQGRKGIEGEGTNVMPVYLSMKNPLRMVDNGNFRPEEIIPQLYDAGLISDREHDKLLDRVYAKTGIGGAVHQRLNEKLRKIITDSGYDGIVYLNRREGVNRDLMAAFMFGNRMTDADFKKRWPTAEDSYIAFDPKQIKSATGNIGTYDPSEENVLLSRAFPERPSKIEVREGEIGMGIEPRLQAIMIGGLYKGNLPRTMVKEGLQNAVDALRRMDFKEGERGHIELTVNTANRMIRIQDNGTGMPPDVVKNQFVNIGGTWGKEQGASGGLGIAIAALMGNAEKADVRTVYRDPETGKYHESIVTSLHRDDRPAYMQWSRPMEGGLKFETRVLDKPEPTGTLLRLQVREPFQEAENTKFQMEETGTNGLATQAAEFLARHRLPYDFDMNINGKQITAEDARHPDNIPVKLIRSMTVPGADIEIYGSDEMSPQYLGRVQVLNNGLPQFVKEISLPTNEAVMLPNRIMVDVHAHKNPEEDPTNYPFLPSREDLSGATDEAVKNYVRRDLTGEAIRRENQLYTDTLKKAPKIKGGRSFEVGPREKTVDLSPWGLTFRRARSWEEGGVIREGDWIVKTDDGLVLTHADGSFSQEEALKRLYPDIKEAHTPEPDEPQFPKTANDLMNAYWAQAGPLQHRLVDTTGQMPKELIDRLSKAPYAAPLTNALQKGWEILRNRLMSLNEDYQNVHYAGFGTHKSPDASNYYGINLPHPMVFQTPGPDIVLLNPYATADYIQKKIDLGVYMKGEETQEYARHMAATMTHELIHRLQRNHYEGFSSDLTAAMSHVYHDFGQVSRLIEKALGRGEAGRETFGRILDDSKEISASVGTGKGVFGKIGSEYAAERGPELLVGEGAAGERAEGRAGRAVPEVGAGREPAAAVAPPDVARNIELGGRATDHPTIMRFRRDISGKEGQLNIAANPIDGLKSAMVLGYDAYHTIKDFKDWSKEMLKKAGEAVRPILKDLWTQVQAFHGQGAAFYSPLRKTLEAKMTGPMDASDLSKLLKGQGISDAEMEETRFNSFLKKKAAAAIDLKSKIARGETPTKEERENAKVTPQEAKNWIDRHEIKINEVIAGEAAKLDWKHLDKEGNEHDLDEQNLSRVRKATNLEGRSMYIVPPQGPDAEKAQEKIAQLDKEHAELWKKLDDLYARREPLIRELGEEKYGRRAMDIETVMLVNEQEKEKLETQQRQFRVMDNPPLMKLPEGVTIEPAGRYYPALSDEGHEAKLEDIKKRKMDAEQEYSETERRIGTPDETLEDRQRAAYLVGRINQLAGRYRELQARHWTITVPPEIADTKVTLGPGTKALSKEAPPGSVQYTLSAPTEEEMRQYIIDKVNQANTRSSHRNLEQAEGVVAANLDTGKTVRFGGPRYQTPGGTNYKEFRISIPEPELGDQAFMDYRNSLLEKYDIPQDVFAKSALASRMTPEEKSKLVRMEAAAKAHIAGRFRQPHWTDEPYNILHARTTDRNILLEDLGNDFPELIERLKAQGRDSARAFHVEELQSDYGQGIRRKGVTAKPEQAEAAVQARKEYAEYRSSLEKKYGTPYIGREGNATPEEIEKLRELTGKLDYDAELANQLAQRRRLVTELEQSRYYDSADMLESLRSAKERGATDQQLKDYRRELEEKEGRRRDTELADLHREIKNLEDRLGTKIPPAPFVGSTEDWSTLALRRLMRYAAENGYDLLTWSPGSEQYYRWGSERIDWKKSTEGRGQFKVNVKEQHQGQVGDINLEEQARQRGVLMEGATGVSTEKGLRSILAKTLKREESQYAPELWTKHLDELAAKIWKQMQTNPEGTYMPRKEGFEGFYDRMIPNYVSKITKKFGARMGKGVLDLYPAEKPVTEGMFGEETGMREPIQVGAVEINPEMQRSLTTEGQPIIGGEPRFLAEARARVRQAMVGNVTSMNPLQLFGDVGLITGADVYKLTKSFAGWSNQMVKRLGAAIKPHLDSIWSQIKQFGAEEEGALKIPPRLQAVMKGMKQEKKEIARNLYFSGFLTPSGAVKVAAGLAGKQGMDWTANLLASAIENTRAAAKGQVPKYDFTVGNVMNAAIEGAKKGAKATAEIAQGKPSLMQPWYKETDVGDPVANGLLNHMHRLYGGKENLFRGFHYESALEEAANMIARVDPNQLGGSLESRAAHYKQNPPLVAQIQAAVGGQYANLLDTLAETVVNFQADQAKTPMSVSKRLGKQVLLVAHPKDLLHEYALMQATKGVGAQQNALARALLNVKDWEVAGRPLFSPNSQGAQKLASMLQLAVTTEVPFIKRPVNAMTTIFKDYLGLSAMAKLKDFNDFQKGVMSLPEHQDFLKAVSKGTIGLGLVALGLGMQRAGLMTGAMQDDYKKRGALYIGGNAIQIGAVPFWGWLLTFGATIGEAIERGTVQGLGQGMFQMVSEHPLLRGVQALTEQVHALKGGEVAPGKAGAQHLAGMAARFVPSAVASAAQFIDRDAQGRVIQRKPEGLLGPTMARIPGLRQKLPERTVLDRKQTESYWSPIPVRPVSELPTKAEQHALGIMRQTPMAPPTEYSEERRNTEREIVRLMKADKDDEANEAFEKAVDDGILTPDDAKVISKMTDATFLQRAVHKMSLEDAVGIYMKDASPAERDQLDDIIEAKIESFSKLADKGKIPGKRVDAVKELLDKFDEMRAQP